MISDGKERWEAENGVLVRLGLSPIVMRVGVRKEGQRWAVRTAYCSIHDVRMQVFAVVQAFVDHNSTSAEMSAVQSLAIFMYADSEAPRPLELTKSW